jgi:integrase
MDKNIPAEEGKTVIGDVDRLPRKADALRAVESLRAEVSAVQDRLGKMTLAEAWAHFQLHELRDPDVGRSPSTSACYEAYFKCQIIPEWGDVLLDDMKAVAVEKWLRSLGLAPGSKAKIRNHLSALFNHAIRHELYTRENPIRTVRQTATRQRDPDVLTIDERPCDAANSAASSGPTWTLRISGFICGEGSFAKTKRT